MYTAVLVTHIRLASAQCHYLANHLDKCSRYQTSIAMLWAAVSDHTAQWHGLYTHHSSHYSCVHFIQMPLLEYMLPKKQQAH